MGRGCTHAHGVGVTVGVGVGVAVGACLRFKSGMEEEADGGKRTDLQLQLGRHSRISKAKNARLSSRENNDSEDNT